MGKEEIRTTIKPQAVVTIFRDIIPKNIEKQWVEYPELEVFFEKGYYIENMMQVLVGTDRYMITFTFGKFKTSLY